ncbi:MAG: helix-turn-helix domain-containing protein [Lewinellaceae bacterium]|jgi:hypothetical protein|nr:helix-turn-helix domain-containing protein [Lewinellaceae bacterium]MBK9335997.1 helix-turn-helix domain-containing protein [Lewinellaceae bacterium]
MVLRLELSEEERKELEEMVKKSAKSHLRERASALLQIADGRQGKEVAFYGLLRVRRRNTVYEWVHRYKAEGIKGLENKPGRGRKPSFFPDGGSGGQK